MIKMLVGEQFYSAKKGTTLLQIKKSFYGEDNRYVAAIIDNELKELGSKIYEDGKIEFITTNHRDGWKIYRRSLLFVMIKAFSESFPKSKVSVLHSLHKGICCEVKGMELTPENLGIVKSRMKEIIERGSDFEKITMSKKEAITLFDSLGMHDKVSLLKTVERDIVKVYKCDRTYLYFFGFLVPNTSYLSLFDVILNSGNKSVTLLSSKRRCPDELIEFKESKGLEFIYDEQRKWGNRMNIHLLGDLNHQVIHGQSRSIIQMAEAFHENKISNIANIIAEDHSEKRVILISGPSSSGKTSFSKRLSLQLRVHGVKPIEISTDNYFVNRDETPLDEHGNKNFETIDCIDMDTFNRDILALLNGETVELPTYDFISGKRVYNGDFARLQKDQPVIIEGIHSLNPKLTKLIPNKNKIKIYVSPLTQLRLDDHNRVSTADIRLIRRIVRDNQFRGYSAIRTLDMWDSVRKGENEYIYPFQDEADMMFNTSFTYDISVLRPFLEPLLKQISSDEPSYTEARRLLGLISYFEPIHSTAAINPNSIMKEFIGGQIL